MIDLYYWTTPNGHKITIFLEETGIPYALKPVNIGKGEQFSPAFLRISPNNRIPAIVDHQPADGGTPISIFESGAILQYLGVNNGDMSKGVLRMEPNISVMHSGDKEFRTRTEVKNLNSIRSVYRAIKAETERQVKLYESGDTVRQATLGWDEDKQRIPLFSRTGFARAGSQPRDGGYCAWDAPRTAGR